MPSPRKGRKRCMRISSPRLSFWSNCFVWNSDNESMSTANWFSAAITAPELLKLHQSTHNPMTKHIEYIESYQIHRKFWFAYLREFIQPHSWNLARFKDSSTLFIGRCRSLANLNKKLQNTSKTVDFLEPEHQVLLALWIFSSCLFLCWSVLSRSGVFLFSWLDGKKTLPRISAFIWHLTQRCHPHQPAYQLISYIGNSIVNSNYLPVPQVAPGTVISGWDGWCDAGMRVGDCTSTFYFQH